MLIGQPATPPPEGLTEALVRACAREPLVEAAYLFQMAIVESEEDPHLAVGLELDVPVEAPETSRIVQAIGDAIQPEQWGYEFLDFHLLSDEMLESVSSDAPPVYRREEA
jgi:hypothetical protein